MRNFNSFKKLFSLLLILMSIGLISKVNAQNGWEQMASMDEAKGGSQSCVIDNMIYVFGGNNSSNITLPSADAFNTVSNEWSKLENIPFGTYESNAEAINNRIYLVGGWYNTGVTWKTSNSTFEYDPVGDSWMEKLDCPEKTGTNTSCVLNDTLYILGGLHDFADNDTSGQKGVFVYDPSTDTWDSKPNMLYERGEGAAASVMDNKIYVFGGLLAISENPERLYIVEKSEMYDPVSNMWTEIADMPVPVVNHISIDHDEKLYVFAGDSGIFTTQKSYGTNIIQEYNPATDEWSLMHCMPFNRGNLTGQKVGNYLYLFGGYLNSRDFYSPLSEVWKFNLDSLKPAIPVIGISLDMHTLEITDSDTDTIVPTVYPTNASYPSVYWTSADDAVATVTGGFVTGIAVGQTYIYVTTNDGSFKDSCHVSVTPGVGITNTNADRLSIFPNPSNGTLTIETDNPDCYSIKIHSLNGQLIHKEEMEGSSKQIDMTPFSKGIYFVTVRSKEFVRTEKVVKY